MRARAPRRAIILPTLDTGDQRGNAPGIRCRKKKSKKKQKTRTLVEEQRNACVTAVPCVSIGFAVIRLNSWIPTAETKGWFHPNITVMAFFFFLSHAACPTYVPSAHSSHSLMDRVPFFFSPSGENVHCAVVPPLISSWRSPSAPSLCSPRYRVTGNFTMLIV